VEQSLQLDRISIRNQLQQKYMNTQKHGSPVSEPQVSIVIPLYNEEEYISDCLTSLVNQDFPANKFEIIVVDNGSSDKSLDISIRFDVAVYSLPDVKVGAVRNYGASVSRGEILVFIDADCTADENWLSRGVSVLADYDAVGGLVKLRDNPSWVEKYWILNDSNTFIYQHTFSGACIFINKQIFESVNGFSSELNAGEDSKLTYDLIDRRYRISINPELNVTHLGYPQTVSNFINRQRWHSADYAFQLHRVFRDKTLFLTVTYLIMFVVMGAGIATNNLQATSVSVLFLLIIPMIFSLKRIVRYGGLRNDLNVFAIYAIDSLYVIGRVMGLLEGIGRVLLGKRAIKIDQ